MIQTVEEAVKTTALLAQLNVLEPANKPAEIMTQTRVMNGRLRSRARAILHAGMEHV